MPTIKEWTVYPNPTKGQFRIKGDLGVDNIVRIYNTLGQLEFVSEIGQKEFSLNLKAGVYFVKVGEESQILILE
ncbi:MAG: T9SS type A sorting domain-containing protein [Flavobacteriales bacterium]|nr:T9SS type A sorting domain-containing protein [Flavobacteriales bacterium]